MVQGTDSRFTFRSDARIIHLVLLILFINSKIAIRPFFKKEAGKSVVLPLMEYHRSAI
jgi:hypothetical protein